MPTSTPFSLPVPRALRRTLAPAAAVPAARAGCCCWPAPRRRPTTTAPGRLRPGPLLRRRRPAEYESGYSYLRNLRGDATLILADGERRQVESNQPVLAGDRLWVAPGSLAEVLLSDGNLLRLDGGSEVSFEALAGSPESRDRSTALRLPEGNVQLVVFSDVLGTDSRVDLPNATVYVGEAGRYRLTSDVVTGPRWWARGLGRDRQGSRLRGGAGRR